ncbi:MAG: VOC family protein [Nocardioides sp.]|uniref:VOC family protein n=1 Tax=Nocardioides sp. TaxID=35761 RepID=UPI003D6A1C4F
MSAESARPSHREHRVALRLGFAVIGVVDMERAAAFWTAALDLVDTAEWRSDQWRTLCHRDGSRALGLQRSDSPVEPRPRIHLDLFVDSAADQADEVERLLDLGAQRVQWDLYPPNPDFVVLADPDDNLFCVVDLSYAPST